MSQAGRSATDKAVEEATAWDAVASRDRSQDGHFVYGVSSTGVFCRPSCPSRRPRRDRVRFFLDPALARAAGFRACKRCRPEGNQPNAAAVAIGRARAYLDLHVGAPVRLATLAREAGLSPWHLQRTFKRIIGLSPREYAESLRTGRLRSALRSESSVSRATFETGFGSSSRLYERAHILLGMTPGAYRQGGAGMEIRYTIVASPFGRLLVGVTVRGVAAVLLGDHDAGLVRDLKDQFPRATLERVDAGAEEWLGKLVRQVAARIARPGEVSGEPLPLDLAGTAFQWKVWQALLEIPPGQTVSYQQLAQRLGAPRSVRAVASAVAANRAAVIVPCHRVIRSDGSLGGYRWGLPRKKELLAAEQQVS
jgi:AraC family transcriptional regulator of adaptative response/methylated-DNA-[protein]-cysteine methyltransferase